MWLLNPKKTWVYQSGFWSLPYMSEIDDIFASRRLKAITPVASSSSLTEKKKTDKKRKREPDSVDDVDSIRPKTRPAPQTIMDPSSHISSKQATHKDRIPEETLRKLPTTVNQSSEAYQKFKDSRGSGPS
jgi:hypothetical protein